MVRFWVMAEFLPIPIAEQVAEYLRGELLAGRWVGEIPGRNALADELGVNHKTVEVALGQLERMGLLVPQGAGRRRLIQLPKGSKSRALKVALLLHDPGDRRIDYMIDLQHKLTEEGHQVTIAPKSLSELKMNLRRLGAMIRATDANVWVVLGGSQAVLESFIRRKIPVFALAGRRRDLMLSGASPDKPPAYAKVTRELIKLGHRRIVLLCPPDRRVPEPGASERAFLAEMAVHGIPLSRFQLPEWDGSADGLRRRLEAMFRFSPPTAMIVDEAPYFALVLQFLARRGLRVPEDVSLVCTDHADWFDVLRPTMAHISWDSGPLVRRIVQWTHNMSLGKPDLRQVDTPAEFVPGGTIGPAR